MPDPASAQGEHTPRPVAGRVDRRPRHRRHRRGLIFWAIIRFRRRSDDEIPCQTRYNLPLEIFYTIAPIIMVDRVLRRTRWRPRTIVLDEDSVPDDICIEIVGAAVVAGRSTTASARWTDRRRVTPNSTTSSRTDRTPTTPAPGSAHPDPLPAGRRDHALQPALARRHPRLRRPRLPDEDGRHPGPREPLLESRPTTTGTFAGKCYELCGVYHSRMLFEVKVVSPGGVRRPRRAARRRGRRRPRSR